jgi:hypothetical protein
MYLDRALAAGYRRLVAVEGVFDAALLQARGETNVVAYVGAAFTAGQLATLEGYGVEAVTIVPDADGGGARGAEGCVRRLLEIGIAADVASLPEGLDPDEFVLDRGLDAWRALAGSPTPGLDYLAARLLEGIGPDCAARRARRRPPSRPASAPRPTATPCSRGSRKAPGAGSTRSGSGAPGAWVVREGEGIRVRANASNSQILVCKELATS